MPPPSTRSNSPMPDGMRARVRAVHELVGLGAAARLARAGTARGPCRPRWAPPAAPRRSCSTRRSRGSGPSHLLLSNPHAWQPKTVLNLGDEAMARSMGSAPDKRGLDRRPRGRSRRRRAARAVRCGSPPPRRWCPPTPRPPRRRARRRRGSASSPSATSGRSVRSTIVRSMHTVPRTGTRPPRTTNCPWSRMPRRARHAVRVADRDACRCATAAAPPIARRTRRACPPGSP